MDYNTMQEDIRQLIESVRPADCSLAPQAQAHLDNLTKPQGSLGMLEEIAVKFVVASGRLTPVLEKKKISCFVADHGSAKDRKSVV